MRTYSELKELGPTCSLIHLATKTNVGIHPKNAPTVKATAIPKNSSHEPQDLTGFLTSWKHHGLQRINIQFHCLSKAHGDWWFGTCQSSGPRSEPGSQVHAQSNCTTAQNQVQAENKC